MSFETVYFPMTGSNGEREVPERGQTVVRFWDAEMPALYAMSVRDQDESRGLVAFGNAFGELSLYDFSGSPANDLEGCFLGTAFPPLDATHTERLPAVSVIGLHCLSSCSYLSVGAYCSDARAADSVQWAGNAAG